jgi:nitronate monooxygenase
MSLKSLKIGKYIVDTPIIQGGMGVGISWDKLAGNVSKEGGLGVISAVGTGYYQNQQFLDKAISLKNDTVPRPYATENFYSANALNEIIKNARAISGDKPLAVNILYAINDYGKVVVDACKSGIDIIITGAGLPIKLPEYAKDYPDVALVPIVSSVRALKLIMKKWSRSGKNPDAVIVEGPLSGGHQGFSYEQCFQDEFQLESILPPIIDEAQKHDIPVIAAGGIWDKADIDRFMDMGCAGVQIGTRFIGTFECDVSDVMKDILINAKEDDIKLMKSPVGLPARGVQTALQTNIENGTAPKVTCVSNCIAPCHSGKEAKAVGFCIADRLGDAYLGDESRGLFFSGSNGYKIDKIISVKELMHKLVDGEDK